MRPCELCGRVSYETDVIVTVKHPQLKRFETAKVVSRFEREGWMSAFRVRFFCDNSQWSVGQRDCTILGEGRKHIENVPVVRNPKIWNEAGRKAYKGFC